MNYKERMLLEITTHYLDKSVTKVISKIKKRPIDTMLFSETCDMLNDMWEEVCVQVQEDMGWAWPSYDYTVRDLCEKTIKALPQSLHVALTYHVCQKYGIKHEPDAISLELISDEVKERVYAIAYKYSNKRIEAFVALNYPNNI